MPFFPKTCIFASPKDEQTANTIAFPLYGRRSEARAVDRGEYPRSAQASTVRWREKSSGDNERNPDAVGCTEEIMKAVDERWPAFGTFTEPRQWGPQPPHSVLAIRNPKVSARSDGASISRDAERIQAEIAFHPPPRMTRAFWNFGKQVSTALPSAGASV